MKSDKNLVIVAIANKWTKIWQLSLVAISCLLVMFNGLPDMNSMADVLLSLFTFLLLALIIAFVCGLLMMVEIKKRGFDNVSQAANEAADWLENNQDEIKNLDNVLEKKENTTTYNLPTGTFDVVGIGEEIGKVADTPIFSHILVNINGKICKFEFFSAAEKKNGEYVSPEIDGCVFARIDSVVYKQV